MIIRAAYFEKLIAYDGQPLIKVITGIRRVGKSTLLMQFRDHLLKKGVPATNIFFLQMDLYENKLFRNPDYLHAFAAEQLTNAEYPRYILIDEVQEIEDWERLAASWLADKKADIYLTGSNARLLSGDLATALTGRTVEIPVYPLSLGEYSLFRKTQNDLSPDQVFNDYLAYGGMPGLHHIAQNGSSYREYLDTLLDAIIYKDVIARHGIRSTAQLSRIIDFAFDSVGTIFSARSIANYFKSQRLTIAPETVISLIDRLCDARLFYKVPRYDIRGKKHLEFGDKYYLGDIGFLTGRLGFSPTRLPGILENLVFLELCRRRYRISVGTLNNKEVDFVAEKENSRVYIQVTLSMVEPQTATRETQSLTAIDDHFPKQVLSLDPFPFSTPEGIECMNIRQWLME